MIEYKKHKLSNGLKLIFCPIKSQTVSLNLSYKAGSKNEFEDKTGLAHVTEHMMFCGSKNIKNYDYEVQKIGGINNAYTTFDFTNYYCVFPSSNIEVALWIESDRFMEMDFSEKSLEIQKKLIVEEYKETHINRPYGDLFHNILDLSYKNYPYKWPTIGKNEEHILSFNSFDIKNFFEKNYSIENASLIIVGDIEEEEVLNLSEKWFGKIKKKKSKKFLINKEEEQKERRERILTGEVPFEALYKIFHVEGRLSKNFAAVRAIQSILSEGNSCRFYKKLVDQEKIFNSIDAFLTESLDGGLLIIGGTICENISLEDAEKKLDELIFEFSEKGVLNNELEKFKNNFITSSSFDRLSVSNIAENLAIFAALGDEDFFFKDQKNIELLDRNKVNNCFNKIFKEENSSVIFYKKNE